MMDKAQAVRILNVFRAESRPPYYLQGFAPIEDPVRGFVALSKMNKAQGHSTLEDALGRFREMYPGERWAVTVFDSSDKAAVIDTNVADRALS